MAYTTINKGSSYFNTKIYTGTGATASITGVGFQPDWVWFKNRSTTNSHSLFDSLRGVTKNLITNSTAAESTNTQGLTSFNSDGFTVGNDADVNGSSNNMVAWNWLANGAGVSNTAGTITSTVSANTTSGFSIVSYTGTGASATVGHGLGVAPSFLITKNRSGTDGWIVHTKAITATTWWDTRLLLASTATAGSGAGYLTAEPTSTLFAISSFSAINASGNNYITYCFAEVKGFSKFGSYTGNSSTDGTFVYLGFKPAFVIIKNITNGNNWIMLDNKRGTYNLQSTTLYPNTNDAEDSTTTNFGMDFLSNGIKMRTSGGYTTNSNNASGNTYIYMAFAENPFVSSKAIPTTAR